ncbi:hypothetical protein PsorP6_006869 [Peronosclerospora sorghi]|uniref:Uncharacterized protein n=1 Tax=Peronosclerospora sorghi TaxID=230839 RepID=A0ACC0W9M6_9STRA|nr:hypothetical protein PsorP6_006869 [Peronosclerospora sorghi]
MPLMTRNFRHAQKGNSDDRDSNYNFEPLSLEGGFSQDLYRFHSYRRLRPRRWPCLNMLLSKLFDLGYCSKLRYEIILIVENYQFECLTVTSALVNFTPRVLVMFWKDGLVGMGLHGLKDDNINARLRPQWRANRPSRMRSPRTLGLARTSSEQSSLPTALLYETCVTPQSCRGLLYYNIHEYVFMYALARSRNSSNTFIERIFVKLCKATITPPSSATFNLYGATGLDRNGDANNTWRFLRFKYSLSRYIVLATRLCVVHLTLDSSHVRHNPERKLVAEARVASSSSSSLTPDSVLLE